MKRLIQCFLVGFVGSFTLPGVTATAQSQFTRVTDGPVATDMSRSFGCAWGDYDNDGWIDLFVATGFGDPDLLYHNNGDGTFSRVTDGNPIAAAQTDSTTGVWGDLNNDGWLDLFVNGYLDPSPKDALYLGLGDGQFMAVTDGAIVNDTLRGTGAAWGDFDNDGFLDLFVANGGTALSQQNFLYRNQGDGTFLNLDDSPVAETPGYGQSGSWSDLDGDGDLDLQVANNSGSGQGQNLDFIYRNTETGFEAIPDHPAALDNGGSNGFAMGDYDNDGDLDAFWVLGRPTPGNELFRNDGDGDFSPVDVRGGLGSGFSSIAAAWADFDNDADLDLVIARSGGRNLLYRNNGGDSFTLMNGEPIGKDPISADLSFSCAWADYDNDGFMDLFIAHGSNDGSVRDRNFLYRNNGNDHHWLKVVCVGTRSNASAIGAKVRVRATIDGEERWQMREISGGGGGYNQDDLRPNFGLKDAEVAEVVRIEWPSGIVQELYNVAADQILTVAEAPSLTITPALILTWSMAAEGYVLESAPSMDGPWTPVETAPEVHGDQTRVTVPAADTMRLFRLRHGG